MAQKGNVKRDKWFLRWNGHGRHNDALTDRVGRCDAKNRMEA